MGLALLVAVALQAAATDPTSKIYDVEFAPLAPSERQYAHLGPAGPYFPEHAFRAHQSGEGLLRCTAGSNGELQQCVHAGEKPGSFGFADAAWILAARGRVKAAGAPSPGESILLRVPFTLGAAVDVMDHPARAPTVKAFAPDVRGHAEVGCFVTDNGLDRCFVLYFQSRVGRPAAPAAAFAAVRNDTAAALAATAQVSAGALPKHSWVIIPMDLSPKS